MRLSSIGADQYYQHMMDGKMQMIYTLVDNISNDAAEKGESTAITDNLSKDTVEKGKSTSQSNMSKGSESDVNNDDASNAIPENEQNTDADSLNIHDVPPQKMFGHAGSVITCSLFSLNQLIPIILFTTKSSRKKTFGFAGRSIWPMTRFISTAWSDWGSYNVEQMPAVSPNTPQELYDLLVFKNHHLNNPLANQRVIFDEIFDGSSNQEEMMELLDAITYEQKQNKEIYMVHSVLSTLLNSTLDDIDISSDEASFSYYIVWPLIHAVIKAVDKAVFHPGEYYLKAITSEFARRRIPNNQHYKADGCVSVNINNVNHELLLLEISGHYKLEDQARFTKDHIKAGYGLLAM